MGTLPTGFALDGPAIHRQIDALAAVSEVPAPVVTRVLFSDADLAARRLVAGWCEAAGLATNRGFAGFSRFDTRDDFAALFERYLAAPEEELFYRGTLFVALDRAFLERREVYGAKVGPAAPAKASACALTGTMSCGPVVPPHSWIAA